MLRTHRLTRLARVAVLASAALIGFLPGSASATDDYPSFYATIVGVAADHGSLTVSPTRDQLITVDVRQLGSEPFDLGAFALENVVLLHTMRVGNSLIATGWEQARNGDEESTKGGIEPRRTDREKKQKDDEPRRS